MCLNELSNENSKKHYKTQYPMAIGYLPKILHQWRQPQGEHTQCAALKDKV
jgi:hypothetical protein